MMNGKRLLCAFVLLTLVTVVCCGCTVSLAGREGESETSVERRDDVEQLDEWFPMLSGAVSADWEIEYDDPGDASLPAPSGLSARGYITLDDSRAKELLDAYDWSEVSPTVEFSLLPDDRLNESEWLYSWEFERDVRGAFIGHMWFDGKDTVLFDGGK